MILFAFQNLGVDFADQGCQFIDRFVSLVRMLPQFFISAFKCLGLGFEHSLEI